MQSIGTLKLAYRQRQRRGAVRRQSRSRPPARLLAAHEGSRLCCGRPPADAAALRDQSGASLLGWWVGRGEDDAVGHLLRITRDFGRLVGTVYSARDITDLGLVRRRPGICVAPAVAAAPGLACWQSSLRAAGPWVARCPPPACPGVPSCCHQVPLSPLSHTDAFSRMSNPGRSLSSSRVPATRA